MELSTSQEGAKRIHYTEAQQELLQRLMEAHNDDLLHAAYRILPHHVSDAEDVVQQTWIAFAAHMHEMRKDPKGWLLTVVRRKATEVYRRKDVVHHMWDVTDLRVGDHPDEFFGVKGLDPSAEMAAREIHTMLSAWIAELPVEQRETIAFHLQYPDATFQEMGEVFGTFDDTQKSRQRLAIEKIREKAHAAGMIAADFLQ